MFADRFNLVAFALSISMRSWLQLLQHQVQRTPNAPALIYGRNDDTKTKTDAAGHSSGSKTAQKFRAKLVFISIPILALYSKAILNRTRTHTHSYAKHRGKKESSLRSLGECISGAAPQPFFLYRRPQSTEHNTIIFKFVYYYGIE